jgi:hypothetical protein
VRGISCAICILCDPPRVLTLIFPRFPSELVNIVRHLQAYPDDPVPTVLRNVLAFDQVYDRVSSSLHRVVRYPMVNVLQMDSFAMTSVRDVLHKRGLSVDAAPSLTAPHVQATVQPLSSLLPPRDTWPSASLTPTPDVAISATALTPKHTSVGYLFSSAVKPLKSVGLHDGRIHGWSPESFVWRLPDLTADTLASGTGSSKKERGAIVVGAAAGFRDSAHVLAK